MYRIQISKEAHKKLQAMQKHDRSRITEKLGSLGYNPNDTTLDIRPIVGTRLYRLRVNYWRIIFERFDVLELILIDKIKPRGDAYK